MSQCLKHSGSAQKSNCPTVEKTAVGQLPLYS